MENSQPDNNDDNESVAANYAKFFGMGFQMLGIIGVFTYAGYKIDQSAGHNTQWVTALLALVGVFIALFIAIRSIKN
ncbi:MAG TPA: AtpZ/AtpI family protein [Mucilaginibacter sp.]|jgi:hypothetical protein|nr:AtpZ/AtpI family protein [Mucilaginibacter sp.]